MMSCVPIVPRPPHKFVGWVNPRTQQTLAVSRLGIHPTQTRSLRCWVLAAWPLRTCQLLRRQEPNLRLLLYGGDKSSQLRDIATAQVYWKEFLADGN